MLKGGRFTFGPDRQRFRNALFRLLTGCKAFHVHGYNFPRSSTPHSPTVEARRQRKCRKYHEIGTVHISHRRQSARIQSAHQDGARRLKACELVVFSRAGHSALDVLVCFSGRPEHASPTEVLMHEIHLQAPCLGKDLTAMEKNCTGVVSHAHDGLEMAIMTSLSLFSLILRAVLCSEVCYRMGHLLRPRLARCPSGKPESAGECSKEINEDSIGRRMTVCTIDRSFVTK